MNSRSVENPQSRDGRRAEGDLDPLATADSTAGGPGPHIRRTLILIALYAIPAAAVLRSITDNDIWMNIRAGQWIVTHGGVPGTDPFSIYGRGREWVAYSWLFEVLIHRLHTWLGLAGVVVYRALMSYAILAALHRFIARREPRFVVATSLAGVTFVALLPLLNERTWLFTILFSTLTLDVILDLRRVEWTTTAWLLPLVFALWANVHIQFIYGLFLLALACAAPLVDGLLGRVPATGHASVAGTRTWWRLLVLAGSCVAATLLNPYHARLYYVVAGYATKADTYNLVVELLASGFRMPWEWAMPLLVGAAAYALGRRSDRSAFEVILLSVTSFLALRARRDVWFAVLAALAILATGRRWDEVKANVPGLNRSRVIVIAAAVGAILIASGWCIDLSADQLEKAVAANYPARAAAIVEERGYRGPLFNEYGWGSYLIWRLPSLPVSIDGRADLHGPERIRRNVETMSGLRGWDRDADLQAANAIIIQANAALASLLRLDARFELVHDDPVAAVFIRRAAARPGVDRTRTQSHSPLVASHQDSEGSY
jgi:hypothetical protein